MTNEEMERMLMHHDAVLRSLEELQMANQVAIGRLNNLIADLAEKQDANLLRVENAVISLAAQVEAFIRRSPNGDPRGNS